MERQESKEDYLECILLLSQKLDAVRSIDVVNMMKFSKPSVSIAMKKLKESGYITIDNFGYIHLTSMGEEVAMNVYDRHVIISKLLMSLGVSEEVALVDACKIEHDLSNESFLAIKEHYEKTLKD